MPRAFKSTVYCSVCGLKTTGVHDLQAIKRWNAMQTRTYKPCPKCGGQSVITKYGVVDGKQLKTTCRCTKCGHTIEVLGQGLKNRMKTLEKKWV